MNISPETIEQVRLSADIVEVIREYLPGLKKVGRNWKANCPFHNEKTPSFMVNAEKGIFHCFGCSAGGDVFKFVMLIDNLSWPEAVRKLAARAGITIRETREETIKRSEKQKLYDLLEQSAIFYNRCLKESSEGQKAREYLEKRGVSKDSIEKFCIGYAPRYALVNASKKRGVSEEQLMSAGVVTKTERGRWFEYMSERLVFPIHDTQGRVVAFGGRTLKDDQPKYLNSPETAVYSKSYQLYGLFHSLPSMRLSRQAVVLEGYMDVVVSHQYGVGNAIATLGTALTQQQAHLLERYAERTVLLFDADPAGITAARRAIDVLLESEQEIGVAALPDGVDPDEYLLKEGKEKFLSQIIGRAVTAVEFLAGLAVKTHGIETPETKARAANDVLPVLDKVKNAVLRREWIKYLAETLQTTEDALQSELRRMRRAETRPADPGNESRRSRRPSLVVRSAEEELLQLLAAYPQYRSRVKENIFREERQRKVYALLAKDVPVAEIVTHLDEQCVGWFTELILEDKMYPTPDQTVNNLLRDVAQRELEQQRLKLQKEIILMGTGQIPADEDKIRLYQDLNRQLKGSVKQ
jgi:DNA primase